MRQLDSRAIAARIRGLIGGQDFGNLGETAARLDVSELSLRMSIDDVSPIVTLDVAAAVINMYGVDPSWLLTGDYDTTTHRAAIETGQHVTAAELSRIAARREARQGPPDLRLEA